MVADMKKLLKCALVCAALFLFLVPAGAQTIYVSVVTAKGDIVVRSNKGDFYRLKGLEVVGMGANSKGVWTLVRTTDVEGRWFDNRTDKHMIGWGEHVLYLNGDVYKKYPFGDPETCCISSAALKVKGDDVVVAGTYARRWEKSNYFWGKMWGELNGKTIYGSPARSDGWQRMSLKRKWFQGFAEPSRGLFNLGYAKTPDVDGNFTSMYHVYACDVMDGDIYTVGWGEREYTYYNAGNAADAYYVRRCARGWVNGKEELKQVPNQTSCARTLTMAGNKDHPIWYTAGHHRGNMAVWEGNKTIIDGSSTLKAVNAEVVVTYNNTVRRYFIADTDSAQGWLYMLIGKALKAEFRATNHYEGRPEYTYYRPYTSIYDIVSYNNQVYLLRSRRSSETGELEISVLKVNLDTDFIEEIDNCDFSLKSAVKACKLAVWE